VGPALSSGRKWRVEENRQMPYGWPGVTLALNKTAIQSISNEFKTRRKLRYGKNTYFFYGCNPPLPLSIQSKKNV